MSKELVTPKTKVKPDSVSRNRKKRPPVKSKFETKKSELLELPLNKLIDNPENGRQDFDDKELHILTNSIQDVGLLDAITVVEDKQSNCYMIISGHRRARSLASLGKKVALCKVVDAKDALQISKIAFYANSARTDLSKIEQATELLAMKNNHKLSNVKLAKIAGLHETKLSRLLKILDLPEDVRNSIDKVISFDDDFEDESDYCFSYSHAVCLLKFVNLATSQEISAITEKCIKSRWSIKQLINNLATSQEEKPLKPGKPDTKLSELQNLWANKYKLKSVKVLKADNDGYVTMRCLESELTKRLKNF